MTSQPRMGNAKGKLDILQAFNAMQNWQGSLSSTLSCSSLVILDPQNIVLRDRAIVGILPSSAGWSQAQQKAAKQLQSNPNAYFYRHVVPHEKQVHDESTLSTSTSCFHIYSSHHINCLHWVFLT